MLRTCTIVTHVFIVWPSNHVLNKIPNGLAIICHIHGEILSTYGNELSVIIPVIEK